MTDFIHFEADCSNDENSENESDYSVYNSFINDESEKENDENYGFKNVQIDIKQQDKELYQGALKRVANLDDYSNLCADSEDDDEIPKIREINSAI